MSNYLYRPNDYSIFIEMDNGKYTHKMSIDNGWYPGEGYSLELLTELGFKPCTEEDFPELAKKHDKYYAFMSWQGRPDGHGGCKGGTLAEFEAYNDLQTS